MDCCLSCEATHCISHVLIQPAFMEFLPCKRPQRGIMDYVKMSKMLLMSLKGSSYCCQHVYVFTRLHKGEEVTDVGESEAITDCPCFHVSWRVAWRMINILFCTSHNFVPVVKIRDISDVKWSKHEVSFWVIQTFKSNVPWQDK